MGKREKEEGEGGRTLVAFRVLIGRFFRDLDL